MRQSVKHFTCLLVAILMALPLAAAASPVTVDFSFKGSTLKGQGYFTYDSSSAPAGGGKVSSTTLLSDFFATINGVSWDESVAESGYLIFGADGSLTSFIVGDNCAAGSCTIASNVPGFLVQSRSASTVRGFMSIGAGTKQDNGSWDAQEAAAVPEPSTGALVALALLGLGLAARRRVPGRQPS